MAARCAICERIDERLELACILKHHVDHAEAWFEQTQFVLFQIYDGDEIRDRSHDGARDEA